MAMNLGAIALVGVLGAGAAGVVAQQNGYLSLPQAQPPTTDEASAPQPGSDADPNLPPPSTSSTSTSSTLTSDADCQSLIAEHQQLTTELDNYDKELERLVGTLKTASSDKAKLDATVTVVEALVAQRRDIRARMSGVHGNTMRYLLTYAEDSSNKVPCPIFETAPEDQMKQETAPSTTPQDPSPQQQPPRG